MKKYFLAVFFLFVFSSSAYPALFNNVSDTFSAAYLAGVLWEETLYAERPGDHVTSSVSGGVYSVSTTINTTGNNELGYLTTDYYFFGDFDAQIDVNQHRDGDEWKVVLAINVTGQSSQFQTNIDEDQWYQVRIQRTGSDINTYYKLSSSPTWILQDAYTGYGTAPINVTYQCGDTSSATATDTYWDNYLMDGYAATDLDIATEFGYFYQAGVSDEFSEDWNFNELRLLYYLYHHSIDGLNPDPLTLDDKTWVYIPGTVAGKNAGDYWVESSGTQSIYLGDGTVAYLVDAVVPEPITLSMLITGILGLAFRLRKK